MKFMYFSIKYRIIEKNITIYNRLYCSNFTWYFVVVVMSALRYIKSASRFTWVIKVDPRCTSVVWFHGISRNWPRQFRLIRNKAFSKCVSFIYNYIYMHFYSSILFCLISVPICLSLFLCMLSIVHIIFKIMYTCFCTKSVHSCLEGAAYSFQQNLKSTT